MIPYKKAALAVVLLLLVPSLAAAQDTGVISGVVVDANNDETIPGANVLLVETGEGTSTGIDGQFRIEGVPASADQYTLRVSFLGYETSETLVQVDAGQETEVEVSLGRGAVGLQEVVVTALGETREARGLGYSPSQVQGEEIARAAEPNITNALTGKAPGVEISSSSGQPGKSSRIVIRGNTSYQGDNQPLIVIDGQTVSNSSFIDQRGSNSGSGTLFSGGTANRLLDIDPNAIESVNILKNASATALYGSRAANGAIIITTKDGSSSDGLNASFTSNVGFSNAIIEGYQDEYLQGLNGGYRNGLPLSRGGYNELADPNSPNFDPEANPGATQTTSNWGPSRDSVSQAVLDSIGAPVLSDPRADFYERGMRIENSLSISGSGDYGNANLTITNSRNDGIVPTTELNKTTVQAKYSNRFTDDFSLQISGQYGDTNQDYVLEANGPNAYQWSLQSAPLNFDITDTVYDDTGDPRRFATGSTDNPLYLVENMSYTSGVNRFLGNVQASYDVTDWLTLKERFGVDTYTDRRKERVDIGTTAEPNGRVYDQSLTETEINSDLTATVNKELSDDFVLDLILGNNINRRSLNNDYLSGTELNIPGFFNVSNASATDDYGFVQEQVLIGAYANATLNFRDHTYLTLTGRNDWSSTLPQENNSFFYPSASLSFVFSDAFSDVFDGTVLSSGKLRSTVAQVGSDTSPYSLATTYTQANPGDGVRGNVNFPFRGQNSFYLEDTQANVELQPEITTEYEVGTDLGFFRDRANIGLTYYSRTTEDQIFPVPFSGATGFSSRTLNAGEIRNRGFELQLSGTPVQVGDFVWDLRANYSNNSTEVLSLSEGVPNIFLFGFTSIQIRAEEGENGYGIIYGSRYMRNGMISEENPVTINGETRTSPLDGYGDDTLLIEEDGTPLQASAPGNIGNVQADWRGNLQSTFSWKGLSLSQQWETSQGGDILNFDRYYMQGSGTSVETEDRGSTVTFDGVSVATGEQNEAEVVKDRGYYQGSDRFVFERYVEDASYIKLRELTLAYNIRSLPSAITDAGLSSLRIGFTGRNLVTFSDFSMGDPSGGSLAGAGNGQGFYHGVTPQARTYQISLRLGF